MATTKSLNNDDSVWVTTFFGGPASGRCYTFTVVLNGRKLSKVVTEKDFFWMLKNADTPGSSAAKDIPDDGVRPEFDG